MWLKNVLRKILLSLAVGGHSVFGIGMDREKLEQLLYNMNQTRVEVSISEDEEPTSANPKPDP